MALSTATDSDDSVNEGEAEQEEEGLIIMHSTTIIPIPNFPPYIYMKETNQSKALSLSLRHAISSCFR